MLKQKPHKPKCLADLRKQFAYKALREHKFGNFDPPEDFDSGILSYIYAEKEEARFLITVRARNKFGTKRKEEENSSYNLTDGNRGRKIQEMAEKYNAVAYWMAIIIDKQKYSVYCGPLAELGSNAISIPQCKEGKIGKCFVVKDRPFQCECFRKED